MKKYEFVKATVQNFTNGEMIPYVTQWLVQKSSLSKFVDEYVCFRLGDTVEFSCIVTYECEGFLPPIIKRS